MGKRLNTRVYCRNNREGRAGKPIKKSSGIRKKYIWKCVEEEGASDHFLISKWTTYMSYACTHVSPTYRHGSAQQSFFPRNAHPGDIPSYKLEAKGREAFGVKKETLSYAIIPHWGLHARKIFIHSHSGLWWALLTDHPVGILSEEDIAQSSVRDSELIWFVLPFLIGSIGSSNSFPLLHVSWLRRGTTAEDGKTKEWKGKNEPPEHLDVDVEGVEIRFRNDVTTG